MNHVHGFSCSVFDNDSVHDLGIKNRNKIILTKAKEMMEGSIWRRKFRVWWLSIEDRNTSFFRKVVSNIR